MVLIQWCWYVYNIIISVDSEYNGVSTMVLVARMALVVSTVVLVLVQCDI